MSPNDDTRDEELLARYRRAGADAAGPSDAVRAAILAESRRVAAELAKQAPQPTFDASRPAANDSRWKIPVFGTIGAALLAALIFAPRYWENAPPAQVTRSSTEPARQSPSESNSRQEVVVTQAQRKSSKTAGPPSNAAQSYAPGSPSTSKNADRAERADSALKPATLQSAAVQGDVAQATALLEQGAVIDARDEAGRTPLMLAVTQGRLEIVRLLLTRGADPNAADNAGHTPLQQARRQNSPEIAALLEGWQRARSAQ
jgi:hypothetical protein